MNKEELFECLSELSQTNNLRDGIDIRKEEANIIVNEIERLNNIINELEKWLEERLEKLDINGYDDDVFNGIELALQKLKELKGNNKENV